MYISLAWAFKDDAPPAHGGTNMKKRLGKDEFMKLGKSGQQRYLKLYPQSSHRFLVGGGAGPKLGQRTAVKERQFGGKFAPEMPMPKEPNMKTGMVVRGADRLPDTVKNEQKQRLAIRRDIADFNKANVAVINPQSLSALNSVKDEDLRQASSNIKQNKQEITRVVQEQAKKQPVMYRKGLDAVKSLMDGSKKPDEMRTTEKHAMQKVLAGVATMALFGAGMMVCSMAGAPLGVLAGRVMFDMWAGSKHGKNLRDDVDELRRLREKRRQAERKAAKEAAGVTDDDDDGKETDDEIHARIQKRKDAEKQVKGKIKATASDEDGADFEEDNGDHSDTINLIVDQVSDILQYHSARDFQLSRDEMFATASADSLPESLTYLLNLAHCDNYEKCGDGMLFDCNGGIGAVQKLFSSMGYTPSITSEGEYSTHHFENDKARASVGLSDNRYYIRYDGDFDSRIETD